MSAGENQHTTHFFRGVILVVVMQTAFMGGGLMIERLLDAPVTGIPSVIGLSLVLAIGAFMSVKMSQFVLLGSFTFAFLAPLMLFAVAFFNVFPVVDKLVYFSIGYLSALTLAVWFYFAFKIIRGEL